MTNPNIWAPGTSISANSSIRTQSFEASASQSVFTLTSFTYEVGTGSLYVYVSGLMQRPSIDFFETAANTFTLSTPVQEGTIVLAVATVEVSAVLDQTFVVSDYYNATGGETVVTWGNFQYDIGGNHLRVFRNGLLQEVGYDYTETSNNSVTFLTALEDGDRITFLSNVFYTESADGNLRGDLLSSGGSNLVGYTQGGTGAVARIVQEKLREVVSVKDFGAVGDASNQTTAILAAIAAVDSGEIYFPPGTYVVNNGVLRPKSNTTWRLAPGALLKNVTTVVQYNIIIIGTDEVGQSIDNFKIYGGGEIEGYVMNDATENAILINVGTAANNITIEDITFTNSMGEAIYIGTSSTAPTNISINNCHISGARRNGIAVTAGHNVRIINNTIKDTYNPDHNTICSGIDIEPDVGQYVSDVIVSSNRITGNYGSGITVYGGAGSVGAELISSVILENNFFADNCKATPTGATVWPRATIDATTTLKLSVTGNSIASCNKQGGISIDASREGVVVDNLVTGEKSTGTYQSVTTPTTPQFLSGLIIAACVDFLCMGNTLKVANYHGIYLFQSTRTIVSNNHIFTPEEIGIASESNVDCLIAENIIYKPEGAGVYSINDNYGEISGNRITDCNVDGATGTNIAGAAIAVTYSGSNTPTNMRVVGNTVRTPTTTATYGVKIGGIPVAATQLFNNDLRGTFHTGAIGDLGSNTITEVVRPAFTAVLATSQNNVTGNGTVYKIVFGDDYIDRTASYNTATGDFTAPVTGLYQFNAQVWISQTTAGSYAEVVIVTSNRTYSAFHVFHDTNGEAVNCSCIADMDAGDTAYVTVYVTGVGADTCDLYGAGGGMTTRFSGCLVA